MEDFIRIKPSWQIIAEEDKLIFYASFGCEVSFKSGKVMNSLLQLIASPIEEDTLIEQLTLDISESKQHIVMLIDKMKDLGILENYSPEQLTTTSYKKYPTQISFFDLLHPTQTLQSKIGLQEKLTTSQIMVIGCGGIGCAVLHSLIAAGANNIIIVDGDKVELNNLSKQLLFTRADIGQYKVIAAKKQLLRLATDANIIPAVVHVANAVHFELIIQEYGKPDFIFLCADEPLLPLWLDEFCGKYAVPFIKTSYLGSIGFIGPMIVPGGKKFAEVIDTSYVGKLNNPVTDLHNCQHKHASTVFTNSIIANLAVLEAFKYLLQLNHIATDSSRLYFDFKAMTVFYDTDL